MTQCLPHKIMVGGEYKSIEKHVPREKEPQLVAPESHPSQRLTIGSCLIQRWCWATADGEGTWFQLQQPPDYNQTRPHPATGAKSYTFLDIEPARPAQVCRVLLLRVVVLICFPMFKNCLIPGVVRKREKEVLVFLSFCFTTDRLTLFSFVASLLLGISLMIRP